MVASLGVDKGDLIIQGSPNYPSLTYYRIMMWLAAAFAILLLLLVIVLLCRLCCQPKLARSHNYAVEGHNGSHHHSATGSVAGSAGKNSASRYKEVPESRRSS